MADNTVKITISADGSKATQAADGVASKFKGLTGALSQGLAMGAGFTAVTQGFDMLKGAIGGVIEEANQQAAANAQTEAVLKSTGGAAGVTAQQVGNLADAYSKTTLFSDDLVQGTENMLLTFTSIGKNVFPEATKTALDMAQALGEDSKSAAIQLGKALQDPIQGVTALRRVGVNFNDTQLETIKRLQETGHLEEAQKLILKELANEFGGSAEAAGKTFGGQLTILGHQLDQAKEKIGLFILQGLLPIAQLAVPLIVGGVELLEKGLDGLGDLFGSIGAKIAPVMPLLGYFKDLAGDVMSFFASDVSAKGLLGALADVPAILGNAMGGIKQTLNNFGLGGLVSAMDAVGDVLGKVGNAIGSQLGPRLQGLMSLLDYARDAFTSAFGRIPEIAGAAVSAITAHWSQISSVLEGPIQIIKSYYLGIWTLVKDEWETAASLLMGVIGTLADVLSGHWSALRDDVMELGASLWNGLQSIFRDGVAMVSGIWQGLGKTGSTIMNALKAIPWSQVWGALKAGAGGAADLLVQGLKAGGALATKLGGWLASEVQAVPWSSIWSGVQAAGGGVLSLLTAGVDLASDLASWLGDQIGAIDWSSIWGGIQTGGSLILQGLEAGGDIAGELGAWLKGQVGKIDWSSILSSAKGAGSSGGGLLAGMLGNIDAGGALDAAKAKISELGDTISTKLGLDKAGPVKALFDAFKEAGGGLLSAVAKDLGIIGDQLQKFAQSAQVQQLMESLSQSFTNIRTAVAPAIDILEHCWALLGGVAVAAITGVMASMQPLINIIGAVLPAAFTVAGGIVQGFGIILQTLTGVFANIAQAVDDLIQGHWSAAWQSAQAAVSTAIDGITSLFTAWVSTITTAAQQLATDVGTAIGGMATDMLGKITGFVTDAGTSFGTFVTETGAKLGELVTTGVGKAGEFAVQVLQKIAQFGLDAVESLGTFVRNGVAKIGELPGQAVSALAGLYDAFYNAAWDAVAGFIAGIGSRIEDALGAVRDLGNKVIGAIKGFGQSPWPSFIKSGGDAVDGWIVGVKRKIPEAVGAVNDFAASVITEASGIRVNPVAGIDIHALAAGFGGGSADTSGFDLADVFHPVIDDWGTAQRSTIDDWQTVMHQTAIDWQSVTHDIAHDFQFGMVDKTKTTDTGKGAGSGPTYTDAQFINAVFNGGAGGSGSGGSGGSGKPGAQGIDWQQAASGFDWQAVAAETWLGVAKEFGSTGALTFADVLKASAPDISFTMARGPGWGEAGATIASKIGPALTETGASMLSKAGPAIAEAGKLFGADAFAGFIDGLASNSSLIMNTGTDIGNQMSMTFVKNLSAPDVMGTAGTQLGQTAGMSFVDVMKAGGAADVGKAIASSFSANASPSGPGSGSGAAGVPNIQQNPFYANSANASTLFNYDPSLIAAINGGYGPGPNPYAMPPGGSATAAGGSGSDIVVVFDSREVGRASLQAWGRQRSLNVRVRG